MTDTELEPATLSSVAPSRRPRRPVTASPPPAAQPPTEAPAAPAAPAAPTADTEALPTPEIMIDEDPAAVVETPPAPTRRGKRELSMSAVTVPWESDIPGVRSSEIRAELVRRERRATKLLAEREQVLAAIADIEAALDALGEDPPHHA